MGRRFGLYVGTCVLVLLMAGRMAVARNTPPVIQHTPVTVALQGQSLVFKATVTDDTKVKSVTLFYSTSKDVAPFRLEMQPVGQDVFICSVPDHLLGQASTLTYYIEALDNTDQSTETRWYNVSIQSTRPASKPEVKTASDDSSYWKTAALVGGGLALAGGAAAIIAGSGGGSTPPPVITTNVHAGTYIGSVTTDLEFPGQPPATLSHGTTIVIDINGTVRSTDLYIGQSLFSTLSGSDFTLNAAINETNLTGQVNFYGSVVNGRINGSVGGQVQSAAGTNGTYYGNFYAVKQ